MSTTFWIQVLGVMFGVVMMYFSFIRLKRKELERTEFFLWFICWIVFILIAIMPSVLDPVVETFNFYRKLDFFVVVGFFLLLGLGFNNYMVVKKDQKKVEHIVRKLAIERK